MTTTARFDYYLDLAATEGKKLANTIRGRNYYIIAPRNNTDLCVMPVFEENVVSLYSHTKEIVDTELRYVASPTTFIDAYILHFKKDGKSKNIVTLAAKSNYCWARYYICKELMHSYFYDTQEVVDNAMTDSFPMLQTLIEEILLRGYEGPSAKCQTYADVAAYWAAVEYLIPSDTLPLLNAIFDRFSTLDDESGYTAIARRLRAPEFLVKFRIDSYKAELARHSQPPE